jgi:hypothetical protein
MAACPRCRRPVAVARPTCLYCGAPLPEAALPQEPEPPPPPAPDTTRVLVILDLEGAEPERVGAALGLTDLEAGQRVRRGRFQIHRLAEPEAAEEEAQRLASHRLKAVLLPEAEVRTGLGPLVVTGGRQRGAALELDTPRGPLPVKGEELLLVVEGPITREYQTDQDVRRVRAAGLEPGYRFHLHRRAEVRPLELDPGDFDFSGRGLGGATQQLMRGWVAALGAPFDDAFRLVVPALGPASPGPRGPLSAAEALRAGVPEQGRALVLDNLPQFHFYSAWRGALARRGRG